MEAKACKIFLQRTAPSHTSHSDGSELTTSELETMRAIQWKNCRAINWKSGDLLVGVLRDENEILWFSLLNWSRELNHTNYQLSKLWMEWTLSNRSKDVAGDLQIYTPNPKNILQISYDLTEKWGIEFWACISSPSLIEKTVSNAQKLHPFLPFPLHCTLCLILYFKDARTSLCPILWYIASLDWRSI